MAQKNKLSSKALGEFLSEAQEIVENLNRDILQADDHMKRGKKDPDLINNIFRSAHSLKGSLRFLGAEQGFQLAYALEMMGREGSFDKAAATLDALEAFLSQLTSSIRAHLEQSGENA